MSEKKRRVMLKNCPVGLFWSSFGTLCLMTEYSTLHDDGRVERDAYIVSSGEYFVGLGTGERGAQLVTPINYLEAVDALRQHASLPQQGGTE